MKYDCILWDFDGTLAYTSEDVWASLEYAARECGGSIPQAYRGEDSNLGKPMLEIFNQIVPFLGEDKYEEYAALVQRHYRAISEYPSTRLYDGICELLARLKEKGAASNIVTMKPKEALYRILDKKGWRAFFERCYCPDSFEGKEKTKLELIAIAIKGGAKKRYVYVGDTWSDVRAARGNGIPCIAVTYGDGDAARLAEEKPEYIANNVAEIANILEKEF